MNKRCAIFSTLGLIFLALTFNTFNGLISMTNRFTNGRNIFNSYVDSYRLYSDDYGDGFNRQNYPEWVALYDLDIMKLASLICFILTIIFIFMAYKTWDKKFNFKMKIEVSSILIIFGFTIIDMNKYSNYTIIGRFFTSYFIIQERYGSVIGDAVFYIITLSSAILLIATGAFAIVTIFKNEGFDVDTIKENSILFTVFKYKNLGKHSLVYRGSRFVLSLLIFLMVPIFLNFFGILSLLVLLIPILLGIKVVNDIYKFFEKVNKKVDILSTGEAKIIAYSNIDEKLALESLDDLKDRAYAAVREKEKEDNVKAAMITNISHDIRTPLTSVINYSNILENNECSELERIDYSERIDKNVRRLKYLIESLDAETVAKTLVRLDLKAILDEEIDIYKEKLSERGISFRNNLTEETFIMGDKNSIERIIQNILTNINKYAMENSRVFIELDENEETVILEIKNISKYIIEITGDEALRRFSRGDKSRNTEGSGLGLSIVDTLMTSMRGNVDVDIDGDLFKVKLTFVKR